MEKKGSALGIAKDRYSERRKVISEGDLECEEWRKSSRSAK